MIVPALLCPGANVSGKVHPVAANALPVTLKRVMVKLALPEFFKVSVRLWVLPIETASPKPIRQGLVLRCPEDCAAAKDENETSKMADKSVKEVELHREEEVLLTVRPLKRRNFLMRQGSLWTASPRFVPESRIGVRTRTLLGEVQPCRILQAETQSGEVSEVHSVVTKGHVRLHLME